MGLNTQTYKLWKDRAMIELNVAILHSYQVTHLNFDPQSIHYILSNLCNTRAGLMPRAKAKWMKSTCGSPG